VASKNDLAVYSYKLRAFMGWDIRCYHLSALIAAFGADVHGSAPSRELRSEESRIRSLRVHPSE